MRDAPKNIEQAHWSIACKARAELASRRFFRG